MTPQSVRAAQFKTVRKGLDPDEVRGFLDEVAAELERAQNHSTAMEARARAAVHRLQEVTEASTAEPAAADAAAAPAEPTSEQADAITKTLLLAQRAADTTVAEARDEAERLLAEARDEADRSIASSREAADQLLEEARQAARAVGEQERLDLESDVSSLMARRDFLESDVDHLEKFLDGQRERMHEVAASLEEMADRVPGGLGAVHRPVLSAAADDTDDDTGEFAPDFVASAEAVADDDGAADPETAWIVDDDVTDQPDGPATDEPATDQPATDQSTTDEPAADESTTDHPAPDDATPATGAGRADDADAGFTLRFDDDR